MIERMRLYEIFTLRYSYEKILKQLTSYKVIAFNEAQQHKPSDIIITDKIKDTVSYTDWDNDHDKKG